MIEGEWVHLVQSLFDELKSITEAWMLTRRAQDQQTPYIGTSSLFRKQPMCGNQEILETFECIFGHNI